ncbi:nucleotidyl transferase AbiEii/AbiGii toxin family protein [soil metagenome]
MISQHFKDFIEMLNKHNVQYLIVGGYAVGFHGFRRFTGDLDIWIKISDDNADKMMKVITEFPAPKNLFKKEDFLNEKPLAGGYFGLEPFRIDILNSIDGVTFDECFPNAAKHNFEGTEMYFIHFNDLKKNKLSSGRLKDKMEQNGH